MKAVVYSKYGEPSAVIQIDENFPRPFIDANSDHVLVRVKAASMTRQDLKRVRGDLQAVERVKFPAILGADVAGVVEAVGGKCCKLNVGDEVIGIVTNGSMAEYVAAPEHQWVRKPTRVSFLHAAAFPVGSILAFQCLHVHGKLKEEEKVLVLNASGGVGSLAVQMAKYKKAKVYATASERNKKMVEKLGADHVTNYKLCQWHDKLKGENIDLILDFGVGYSAWAHCHKVLNPNGGRFVSLVGDNVDGPPNYWKHLLEYKWRSFTTGISYKFVKSPDLSNQGHLKYAAKLVSKGELTPVLDDLPFEFSEEGKKKMVKKLASNQTQGKLILDVGNCTSMPRKDQP